jgi:hypothetical protein
MRALDIGPDQPLPRGEIQRKGAGGYTLCGPCNNKMGRWYNPHFLNFYDEALGILHYAKGRPSLTYLYHCLPLPVLKQIVSMFFSVNSERFHEANPELAEFVLNREKRYLSPKYRFWLYYNYEGRLRNSAKSVIVNTNIGRKSVFSEITFPPFGYVLTIDSLPTDDRLCEITFFSRYGYLEYAPVQLQIPVLPTWTHIPGDYRQRDEVGSWEEAS